MEATEVLTIEHSTLPYERFLQLLRRANVTAIADVRSAPYSRQVQQFNRENLLNELRADGIAYVFLGKELGGRPSDRQLYCDGVADHERMSRTAGFVKGLERVLEVRRNSVLPSCVLSATRLIVTDVFLWAEPWQSAACASATVTEVS